MANDKRFEEALTDLRVKLEEISQETRNKLRKRSFLSRGAESEDGMDTAFENIEQARKEAFLVAAETTKTALKDFDKEEVLAATSDTMKEADTCHLTAVREVLSNLQMLVDMVTRQKRADEEVEEVRRKLEESVEGEQKALRKLGRVMEVLADGSHGKLTEKIKEEGEETRELRTALLRIMRDNEDHVV